MNAVIRATDFVHTLPILFVVGWACLVLLAAALSSDERRVDLGPLSALGLAIGICIAAWSWSEHAQPATGLFASMVVVDRFAIFFDVIFMTAALFTSLLSRGYLREHGFSESGFYGVVLLACAGMMMMVHAADFVALVLGLETMSLAIYCLVASWVGQRRSAEGAIKYFVMGAVASAFLLYGIALVYGVTGSTNLAVITRKAWTLSSEPLFIIGMLFIMAALAFKVALVPFHMWTPDAYEGAPTPITGFMAAAVKAAGFAILLRAIGTVFSAESVVFGSAGWANVFVILSALTMSVGNLFALRQGNIKRMLAYSSISHAGYILLGVIAMATVPDSARANATAQGPVLFYLMQYAITTIGAFGIVTWIGRRDAQRLMLDSWSGLASTHPWAALAMTVFMLSLAGIPPTAGFFAKLYLFSAALQQPGLLWVVIIAIFNSVISVYYYLRPVVMMYFQSADSSEAGEPSHSPATVFVLALAVLLILAIGLMPSSPLAWADASVLAGR
ncbi:MAG: NADH-quinone oxidoreductase subunit N [Deltaproteobacteria bacterium]|nr:NADH-quinone oxidoreductase subunit N [Deltaproteobacteria bacterium]